MNKEEKEVIEKFRYGAPLNYQTVIRKLKHDKITDVAITRKEYIDTILNYIDKLQKENEKLKEEIKDLIKENHKHIDYIASMKKKHEDKIRTKIKELEDIKNKNIDYCSKDYFQLERTIEVLKELLGETKDEE